jgi:hypothetical protein
MTRPLSVVMFLLLGLAGNSSDAPNHHESAISAKYSS